MMRPRLSSMYNSLGRPRTVLPSDRIRFLCFPALLPAPMLSVGMLFFFVVQGTNLKRDPILYKGGASQLKGRSDPTPSSLPSPLATPTCYATSDLPLIVLGVVFIILGLQLAGWSFWIVFRDRTQRPRVFNV
ncbi:hypothetical protein PV04_03257 [Phialophora macrospora]|uniref:Uncharacterized protein n=1 Tax=Phialophora macrospora TaxID=1851006 RepID=A0A0D2E9S8_9EURO|nr:hypothetical protein PV04_03257 [Phialophora macrospora]